MKITPTTVIATVALFFVLAGGALATGSLTPREKALTKQVVNLKKQVKTLKAQRNTARNSAAALASERDALKGTLATMTQERDALTGQVTTLTTERNNLQGQVNTLQGQLATAQQGAIPAISTMTEQDLYFTVLPAVRDVILGGSPRYTYDFFSSGTDYSSRSFTFCGFC